MQLFSISELVDIAAMTLFVGYIFSSYLPKKDYSDPLKYYERNRWIDIDGLKFAIMATAPAIIVHELAHKFVAIGFGLHAIFYAFYRNSFYLILGVFALIMKLSGGGFFFIVPGFVGIEGAGTHIQFALTAFAGPFVNLVLWLIASLILKKRLYKKKHYMLLVLTQRINMFLFIFNMLPIPGFDGYGFYSEMIRAFL